MSKYKVPVLPKSIVTSGKWYQPYIHSTPHTYAKSQSKRMGDVKLNSATVRLKELAKATFADLYAYYLQREIQLQKAMGYATHKEFKNEIDSIFSINLTKAYNEGSRNSLSMGIFQRLVDAKNSANKTDALIDRKDERQKTVKQMVTRALKETKINQNSINRSKTFRSESEQLINITTDVLTEFLTSHGLNVGDIFDDLIMFILYNIKPKNKAKQIEDFYEEILKVEKNFPKAMTALQTLARPYLTTTGEKHKIGDPRNSVTSMLATKHGLGAEALITNIVDNMINNGVSQTLGAIAVGNSTKDDSTTEKGKKISDASFQVIINGKKVSFGIDIKATSGKDKIPGEVKYTRGPFNRKIKDIMERIDQTTASTMMYLIANSYFFKEKTTENSYETYLGSGGKIYSLLNALRALYALLPTEQALAASPESVKSIVKTDDRNIVVIDGQVFLMTQFLKAISDQVLKGGRSGASARDIDGAFMKGSLKTILDAYNSTVSGVKTGLYKSKVDLLATMKAKERQSSSAYQKLYDKLVKPAWGGLEQWQYRLQPTTFKIQ